MCRLDVVRYSLSPNINENNNNDDCDRNKMELIYLFSRDITRYTYIDDDDDARYTQYKLDNGNFGKKVRSKNENDRHNLSYQSTHKNVFTKKDF